MFRGSLLTPLSRSRLLQEFQEHMSGAQHQQRLGEIQHMSQAFLLSLLPGTFLPQMNKANFPLSFKSLLKRHLLYEAYLDHPI